MISGWTAGESSTYKVCGSQASSHTIVSSFSALKLGKEIPKLTISACEVKTHSLEILDKTPRVVGSEDHTSQGFCGCGTSSHAMASRLILRESVL